MNNHLRITYRDLPRTDAIESYIRRRAGKLLDCGHPVISCQVAVEAPHRHKLHGRQYRIRIDMTVPGAELVVTRAPHARVEEDLYAAVDAAFAHAIRKLHEHAVRSRAALRSVS